MLKSLKYFERFIISILALLIVVTVLLATGDVMVHLAKDIFFSSPRFLLSADSLLDYFGLFLLIMLGLELLEMVKVYLREDAVHVEVVLIVALIALARKVVVIEINAASDAAMIGLAALILSLAVSYWLVMQVRSKGLAGSEIKDRKG